MIQIFENVGTKLIIISRRGSKPSLISGVSLGVLYALSANQAKKGSKSGITISLIASVILALAGGFRSFKTGFQKPVPLGLLILGVLTSLYFGKKHGEVLPLKAGYR